MEQADGFPSPSVKILVAGSAQGRRIELLEYSDGRVAIICDGAEQAVYHRGLANLESCIQSYLGMLRSDGADC